LRIADSDLLPRYYLNVNSDFLWEIHHKSHTSLKQGEVRLGYQPWTH
ncbi:hypothetical protein CEXT_493581, partial [Caerostris extrusa]